MKLSKIISREWGVFVKLFGVHASEFSRLLHFYGERMKQNYIVKKSYFGQDFTPLPLSNFKCFSLVFIKNKVYCY